MTISTTDPFSRVQAQASGAATDNVVANAGEAQTREQFDKFVGGTFFRQLLGEMQKSVGKAPYFHGGQGEEMFRTELNSQLADDMAKSTAHTFTGPMYDLFTLQRT